MGPPKQQAVGRRVGRENWRSISPPVQSQHVTWPPMNPVGEGGGGGEANDGNGFRVLQYIHLVGKGCGCSSTRVDLGGHRGQLLPLVLLEITSLLR